MEILKKTETKVTFLEKIEDSLINAIRRYIGRIPVLAIDEVEISKNDSALYDETLAHRIGLVPMDSKKINKNKEYEISIKTKKEGIVYSEEIQGDVKPVYDKTPLALLNKGQEINIKGIVRAGIGKNHAKFSPGMIFFRKSCEITLNKKYLEEIKKVIPEKEIKEKGGKIIINDNKEKEICDFCEGVAEKQGDKAEVKESGEMIVTIESFGQMVPKEIFKESISNLKKDLEELSKKIK